MTISSTNRKAGPYSGNGVTVNFPFAFKVFSASDLYVVSADPNGNETVLLLATDYTVVLNANQDSNPGGTVTRLTALDTGNLMTISSALDYLQPTDLTNNGGFYPKVINNSLDRITIFIQQLAEQMSRALKYAITSPLGDSALPTPVANNIIGWNSDANGFQNYAPSDNTLLSAALAASSGSSLVGFLQSGTGAVSRTAQSKLREAVSVKDFGAIGDGVTDEVASFAQAKSNGKAAIIPFGTYKFDSAFDSGDTPLVAFGATLNPLAPATTYFRSYLDIGKKAIVRQSIRDASEYAATPTAYTYINELSSFFVKHQNGAGYQQSYASDSGGRTNVPVFRAEVEHFGYGDVNTFDATMSVSRHPSWASATSWTGQNSVTVVGGEVGAATANVNLYGAEFHLSDNAFNKVAANGLVLDLSRNNAAASVGGAYNTVWTGLRLQTSGTYAADSGVSLNGLWNVGVDFSGATFTNNAAMALKTNDRVYFGVPATSPPNWFANVLSNNYMVFDGTKYGFIASGVSALQVSSTSVLAVPLLTMSASFNVPSSGNIAATVGAAGGASALPANPFTYLKIQIDGTTYKIPVYNN